MSSCNKHETYFAKRCINKAYVYGLAAVAGIITFIGILGVAGVFATADFQTVVATILAIDVIWYVFIGLGAALILSLVMFKVIRR